MTLNGRVGMYSVGTVSLCTRKKKLAMLPMSIPSPSPSCDAVSMHTLSPSPTSTIRLILAVTSCMWRCGPAAAEVTLEISSLEALSEE